MATELGSAFISVGMGTNTLAGDIKKAFGNAEGSGTSAGKSAGKGFGAGFAGIATAAVGALGVGTFLKGAIAGAGELQQSAGAIQSVFKGSAADMLAWSKDASTAVGLTQNEFNELGTLIGAQLKNGGTAMDQLAPKTNSLIGVGADLASMFGGTTADAVGALSSALKGERDPIEKYGVSLTQAKIDAEAAALGFSKVGGALSAEATQAATLSLIMKQTADAQGNFAKEADTMAGAQQRMSAGFKDIQTNIGGLFLPVLTQAFGFINSNILPSLDKFTASLGDGGLAGAFKPVMDVAGPIFSSLAASFGPLIPQVFQLVAAFSPLGLIFRAVQPILPQLVGLFTQLGSVIAGTLSTTLTALMPVVSLFVASFSELAIGVMPAVSQIVGLLGATLATLAPVIAGIITQLTPLITSLMSQLMPIVLNLVSTVLPPLVSIFGQIVGAIAPLVAIIMALLIPIIQALMPVVVTVFGVVADVIKNAMQIVQGIIQVVTGIITGNWSQVWEGISNVFGGIWNTIVALVGGALAIVWSVIQAGLNLVFRFIGDVLGNIGKVFSDTWNNVSKGVSDFIGGVGKFFAELPDKIMAVLKGANMWLYDAGVDIVNGLFSGIKSLASTIGNFFLGLLPGWIVEPFKIALGIHSPSRVFKGFGQNIGQGLLDGVDAMQSKIDGTMSGLVTVPPVPSFGAGSYSAAIAGMSPAGAGAVNVYVGNEQLDARMYSVAGNALSNASRGSSYQRGGVG